MAHAPELLAPAGSLDAVRAAVANGADAVYMGASRFNARDEGAQLSVGELAQACAIAHARGARVYLTFNVLLKTHELEDALRYLGECVDAGIDAAIVQDLGVVPLIRAVYPHLEVHGSTQMTVHDGSGARVVQQLGVERIVLARENTLDDIRSIREAVPTLGLETFVHGALCISYSGQCFMSGMISERSANRGSCAQSCRKDYSLNDDRTGETLDTGYLISAKDLAAHDHLAAIAELGIGCLKVEGRKKKPEYVATVTRSYREWLDRVRNGAFVPPPDAEVQPLVQIFSRGFTGGMYGGRAGRDYITRDQPDNRGLPLGVVVARKGTDLVVEVREPLADGDGLGFEPSPESGLDTVGCTVSGVRTLFSRHGLHRQALSVRVRAEVGWQVVRTSDATLLRDAQASYACVEIPDRVGLTRLDMRCFGQPGAPLKLVVHAGESLVTVRSEIPLSVAEKRALDDFTLRTQLGRLGGTPFVLGAVDTVGLADGCFIPVSVLNQLRQDAVAQLLERREWDHVARMAERDGAIAAAIAAIPQSARGSSLAADEPVRLSASVFSLDDARIAASAGATEVVLDPFLRHPTPSVTKVLALRDELAAGGVALRLRTPTIIRPEDRRRLERWLATDLPLLTGHAGVLLECGEQGRDAVADYAVNVFNPHTAAIMFRLGARRIVASVELTLDEIGALVAPWQGRGFDAFVWGRPEGMTTEHCVLSAAFDREPTTCRDLCVQKHAAVSITDPTGYTFPVATDSDCRNRLLHSRPVDGSEYLPALWQHGVRGFHLVFNMHGDPVESVTRGYRRALDALAAGTTPDVHAIRAVVGRTFTRGHFVRAV